MTKWTRRMAMLLGSALFVLALASPAVSAEQWAYDLSHELMSPYCPGRTLATCPSPQAAELVQWIVLQEAGGATRDEVLEMLVERFGEEILGAPPAEGITLWAYVFPIAGFLVGGGLAFLVLRRIVGGSSTGASPASEAAASNPAASNPAASNPAAALGGAGGVPPAGDAGSADAASRDDLARIVDAELAGRS